MILYFYSEKMEKYNKYNEKEYEPIDVNSLSHFVDMRGLRDYAKEKRVKIVDLSEDEKEHFLIENKVQAVL